MLSKPPSLALWTTLVSCALLHACAVDRLPLTAAELHTDAAANDEPDAPDVPDVNVSVDAGNDSAFDPEATDANASDATSLADAELERDAATEVDAQLPVVDAYVPPLRFEGPCATDHDCNLDEICVRSDSLVNSLSYCAQRCQTNTDCDTGPAGSGAPRCTSSGRCRLPCDAVLGDGCPASMVCQDLLILLPGGDGTCSFQQ